MVSTEETAALQFQYYPSYAWWFWWHTPIIPGTQDAETGGLLQILGVPGMHSGLRKPKTTTTKEVSLSLELSLSPQEG